MDNGFTEAAEAFSSALPRTADFGQTRLKIDNAGRIVIPADMRAAMSLKAGDHVSARIVDGELRLLTGKAALARVRALAGAWQEANTPGDAVNELIADRREEARRDDERFLRLEDEAELLPKAKLR